MPNNDLTKFLVRVLLIIEYYSKWIVKHRTCFFKSNSMFFAIRLGLSLIPFKV